MALTHVQGVSHGFGGALVLEGVELPLERGERVCLVGRNGAGKTTLMKVISGEINPDAGVVARQPGLKTARLEQEVPATLGGSVFDAVADGLGGIGALLGRFHQLSQQAEPDSGALERLAGLQQELDRTDGWRLQQRVEAVLTRLDLDGEAPFDSLSGGWKRRVLLARALVGEPDLLLLDEPTNHLDIPAIERLEALCADFRGALLFISHDRVFVRRVATRIVELDRGRLTRWPGGFDDYQRRKAKALADESRQQAAFDRKLAAEEVWIRKGIQARRTRNEGRVRALIEMRRQRQARRDSPGQAKLALQEAERSGKLVAELEGVNYSYDGVPYINDLTTTILRGDKIGIVGPNGCGKTTLLQLLLGHLEPQAGRRRMGTGLEAAYFDQVRAQLDPEATVADSVADGRAEVTIGGRGRHVISHLKDFLFEPDRARQPVKALSGGERNRLLLARLFARPANLLVMDEPTNDLDGDTLELLEELLMDFDGTLLLVSHDRAFLNNVVTSLLVFEAGGKIGEYVGGYDDWLAQRPQPAPPTSLGAADRPEAKKAPATTSNPATESDGSGSDKRSPPKNNARKLGYMEGRELAALPERIETAEAELAALHETMSEPDYFKRGADRMTADQARAEALEQTLGTLYARWEALEAIQG